MIIKSLQKNNGFVILYAVTLAAILLSVSLGVANITLKEIKFGTSARDTNDAFFAADTGSECAFLNDKSTATVFVSSPSTTTINCSGNSIAVTRTPGLSFWSFVVPGLNNGKQGCAKVTVDKTLLMDTTHYIVTSKGYNNGSGGSSPDWTCTPGSNAVERQIESKY